MCGSEASTARQQAHRWHSWVENPVARVRSLRSGGTRESPGPGTVAPAECYRAGSKLALSLAAGLAAAFGLNAGRSLQGGRPGPGPAAVGRRVGGVALHLLAAATAAALPAHRDHSLGTAASTAAWLCIPVWCAEIMLCGPAMQAWHQPRATIAPTLCVHDRARGWGLGAPPAAAH